MSAGRDDAIAPRDPRKVVTRDRCATHRRIEDEGLRKLAYRDTAHVRLTQAFLEHPERYRQRLFE